MKLNKNIQVFFIILLFGCLVNSEITYAQKVRKAVHMSKPNTTHIAAIQTKIMAKRLNLSSPQAIKVNAINDEFLGKISELQNNSTLSQGEKINSLQTLRESKKNSLKEVLEENQYQEYLKLHDELQEKRSKRIKSEPGSESPDGDSNQD